MKKIKKLTAEDQAKLYEAISNCDIITFDKEEIREKINLAYNLRWAAHESLLESDLLLDEVLKELYGDTKNTTKSKKRTVGKNTRGRRLGKKV